MSRPPESGSGEPVPAPTSEVEAAKAAGMMFYESPDDLDYSQLDPLIAPVCQRINQSGWVWTGESCQGHPDATEGHPWAGNTRPYLRLTCRSTRLGDVLAALVRALDHQHNDDATYLAVQVGLHAERDGWAQIYAYISADTAYTRNLGIAALRRFAENVNLTPMRDGWLKR